LRDDEASDVTQEVFLRIVRGIQKFDENRGASRSWLFAILKNRLAAWSGKNRRGPRAEVVHTLLDAQEAIADLEQRLAQQFDLERLEVAENNVRDRLRGDATWPAYVLTCREGLSDIEAATRLGIPPPHVARYRNRVIGKLKEEVRRLTDLEEGRQAP
jgi:RNA polymerase sigma factor (sigma-70 family)